MGSFALYLTHMKICDSCGHPNYKFTIFGGAPLCNECGCVMSSSPQCRPSRNNCLGQPVQGETNKLSDEVTMLEF